LVHGNDDDGDATESETPSVGAQTISHSQSPDPTNTAAPIPTICDTRAFPVLDYEEQGIWPYTMEEAFVPPHVDPSVAIQYGISSEKLFPHDRIPYILFNRSGVGSEGHYVDLTVPLSPRREWMFMQVWWEPQGALPASFVTEYGTYLEDTTQCGSGGGNTYAQCWIEHPGRASVMTVGMATRPRELMPVDVRLIGIRITMFYADRCTSDMIVEYGTAVRYDQRFDILTAGTAESSQWVYYVGTFTAMIMSGGKLAQGVLFVGLAVSLAAAAMVYRNRHAAAVTITDRKRRGLGQDWRHAAAPPETRFAADSSRS
jgi:hypothetical protein